MDVNVVNNVLSAFLQILPQIGFQNIEKKSLSVAEKQLVNKGLMVNVGVVGPLKGTILFGMSLDGAKQFASKMMMGMEVPEFDLMAQSAISEMCNMVCATTCTNFASTGMTGLDISTPTVVLGAGSTALLSVPKVVVINFLVDNIPVDIYVGLYQSI